MANFTPSPLNEKYFTSQINIEDVGVEGQRLLFNSSVVLLGLSSVGIYVMRGLLAAGIGKICLIDNSIVSEGDIGTHPIFSISDIGKVKGIVLKERGTASWSNKRIDLHVIEFTKDNASMVLPPRFDFAISTSYDPQQVRSFYEVADQQGFQIAGGAALGWTGSFGIYTGRDELYKQKTQIFLRNPKDIRQENCMSGTALTVGGMVTSIALSVLLGNAPKQSARFEMSMKNFTTTPLYEGVNPFGSELFNKAEI